MFKPLFAVIRRECLRLATRPIYWFCMVGAPLLCYVLLTTLMGQGLPTDMPLGMVDNDRTATTRSLARNLDAFQQTNISYQFANVTEARKAMQRGQIYGFYYIPEGTSRKLQRQERPTVSFYCNYSYLIAGSLLFRDMKMMTELAATYGLALSGGSDYHGRNSPNISIGSGAGKLRVPADLLGPLKARIPKNA